MAAELFMYHYAVGETMHGPVPMEELRGRISQETLVWREPMPEWKPARELPELRGLWETPDQAPIPVATSRAAPVVAYAPATLTPTTPGLATASLVLGIVAIPMICAWPLSIVSASLAIVFGLVSRAQCRREGRPGAGIALAGVILGCVPLAVIIMFVLFFVIAFVAAASSS